jgi:hypothetical protein
VRAALWAILAIAALVLVVLLGVVIVRAARSDALVVQPFDVPPALEAKGLTGKVVATQVLDKLAELQVQSESTRPAASYATNWGDELKHGLGHFVGLHVHDAGDLSQPLPAGAVITVEPGLYLQAENYGIRIEDMYLVTAAGSEHLSAGIPRTSIEIERYMAGAKS